MIGSNPGEGGEGGVGKGWSFKGGVRGKGSFEAGGEREDGVVEGVGHWRSG